MTQEEFDTAFEGRAPSVESVQDYMTEEILMLDLAAGKHDLKITIAQAIMIWEYYSEELSASWLAATPERIEEAFNFFTQDPEEFWKYPLPPLKQSS